MSGRSSRSPRLPSRWFVRSASVIHRAIYRVTGGRRGLWRPKADKWGTMRLATIGRRTGRERSAGNERSRLWARWRDIGDDVDAYAILRSSETAVVILDPLPEAR
jgi:F420H(2)-dependent quinone reductase